MQEILLRKLIEKELFTTDTEVVATSKGVDLSGQLAHKFEHVFRVTKLATSTSGQLILEAVSTSTGIRRRLRPEHIIALDGMTPERFAENYMIAPDGSEIKVEGRRRGRRPKNWTPEMEEG